MIKRDKFASIRPFLTDIVQHKKYALSSILYLGQQPYITNNASKRYFRGIFNDIEDIERKKTTASYWLRWPNYWESLEYLRRLGFRNRTSIETLCSLIYELPAWDKQAFVMYVPQSSKDDWGRLEVFISKRHEQSKRFKDDFNNGQYDIEGWDESEDDGFNHIR
jgi:hypothetical protein